MPNVSLFSESSVSLFKTCILRVYQSADLDEAYLLVDNDDEKLCIDICKRNQNADLDIFDYTKDDEEFGQIVSSLNDVERWKLIKEYGRDSIDIVPVLEAVNRMSNKLNKNVCL